MINYIKTFLASDTGNMLKRYLVSAALTFGTTFFTFISLTFASGNVQFTSSFFAGLFIAAVRAAVKALLEKYMPKVAFAGTPKG